MTDRAVRSPLVPMASFFPKTHLPTEPPPRWFWISSLSLLLLGIVFFGMSLVVGQRNSRLFLAVIPVILVCALALHSYYLLHAGRERHAVADAFYATDREFVSVFDHALDGILILDNQAVCLNANPAAFRILGMSREELLGSSLLRFFTDNGEFSRAWNLLLEDNDQRGHAQLVRCDNKIVSVDYAIAANYVPGRHVAILRDTTERRLAELAISKHLAAAEAARAEADALRLSTLTLTKNLTMDTVLDALLASLFEIVPYDDASVILTEDERLYVARTSAKTVQMLEDQQNTFLDRVLVTRMSLFVPDTAQEADWADAGILQGMRSWICVPLIASIERSKSERVLGLLSVGHSCPSAFTPEHFRVAQSLAVSAAVAIQNARLYERAEIYAAELEAMIGKQGQWQARKAKGDV